MLKRIKRLKGEDILMLTLFANTNLDDLIQGKEPKVTKYKGLLIDSSQPENKNVEFTVDDVIDNIMFDNYDIYTKLKKRMIELNDSHMEDNIEDEFHKQLFLNSKKAIDKYIKLYEKLIFESKFEFADIRQIQKFLLTEKLNVEINRENYELCIKLKKRIEEI